LTAFYWVVRVVDFTQVILAATGLLFAALVKRDQSWPFDLRAAFLVAAFGLKSAIVILRGPATQTPQFLL
jgi:hypothetical protein